MEDEQERGWSAWDEDGVEGILKDGRARTSGAGGDHQICISSYKPKTPAMSSGAGRMDRDTYAV